MSVSNPPPSRRVRALRRRLLPAVTLFALVMAGFAMAAPTSAAPAQGTTYNVDGASYASFLSSTAPNLQPGDTVVFKRGDTFEGRLNLRTLTDVTFMAGPGDLAEPVLTGLKPVLASGDTWAADPDAPGAWKADCEPCLATVKHDDKYSMINLLVDDQGSMLALSRWPDLDQADADEGYYYWDGATPGSNGEVTFVDNELGTSPNWVGAEMVTRGKTWYQQRRLIQAHGANGLTTSRPPSQAAAVNDYLNRSGGPQIDRGYFIQNHPDAMSNEGDWYYRGPINEPDGAPLDERAPTTISVMSSTRPTGMKIAGEKYVLNIVGSSGLTFSNLDITGGHAANVRVTGNSRNLTFDGVDSYLAGDKAIEIRDANGVTYRDSEIADAQGNGFYTWRCNSCHFGPNLHVHDIATVAGMGQSDDSQYVGARVHGNASSFKNSVVERVGYNGIHIRGIDVTVENNTVLDFNRVKADGGGIYTNNHPGDTGDLIIRNNTIGNGIGSTAGIGSGVDVGRGATGSHGIYIDDKLGAPSPSVNVPATIEGNTIFNVGDAGIKIHNSNDLVVTDNLVIDAHRTLQFIDNNDNASTGIGVLDVTGNTVTDNRFHTVDADDVAIEARSQDYINGRYVERGILNFANFGDIDRNTYCTNADATFLNEVRRWPIDSADDVIAHSLATWIAKNHDETSTVDCTSTPTIELAALTAAGSTGVPLAASAGTSYYVRFHVASLATDATLTVSLGGATQEVQLDAPGPRVIGRTVGIVVTPTTDDSTLSLAAVAANGTSVAFSLTDFEVHGIDAAGQPPTSMVVVEPIVVVEPTVVAEPTPVPEPTVVAGAFVLRNETITGTVGVFLSYDLCANDDNGAPPVARVSGIYGAGLSRSGCIVSGTPTRVGTNSYTYRYPDNPDTSATATATVIITATAPPTATPAPTATPTVTPVPAAPILRDETIMATRGDAFTYDICANDDNVSGPVRRVTGSTGRGLTHSGCTISGKPKRNGTYRYTYEYPNHPGAGTATVTIIVTR